jgi:hypothetical protein
VKKILFWSFLVLWTFVLVEGPAAVYFLFFARTYYRPLYLEKRNDQWLWRTGFHDWGPWHRPSATAYHAANCFSVTYRSNAYGARDKERSTSTAAPRAVILGDSFIEGYGVDEDKRLSNLLERHAGREVLNFGMTHFGPLQYQLLYDEMIRKFDHSLVIIGFLPNNDFKDNDIEFARQFRDFGKDYIPYYGPDGGVVYPRSRPDPNEVTPFARYARDLPERRRLIHNAFRLSWLYGLYRDIRYNVTVLTYPQASTYIGYMESGATRIARATRSLLAIQKTAAPRPVLVLFLPDYNSWSYLAKHPEAYEKSAVVKMRALLEDHGIKTIDLMKEFMNRGFDRNALYLPCDGHWNERGHQAALEVVYPVVEDLLRSSTALTKP